MPNRLADATSPYLQQHRDNPVDWWQWSAEAFEEARTTESADPTGRVRSFHEAHEEGVRRG
jgi:hypothetical protein